MNYIWIVLVGMILVFFVFEFIVKLKSPDSSLGAGIIAAGLELIASSFPVLIDDFVGLLSFQITGIQASEDVNIWSLLAGFVLLTVGIIILVAIRDRFYVLNMLGIYSQREIGDKQNVKELKLSDYKIRERFIDFVNVFNMGIDERTNNIIVDKIEDECTKFRNRSVEFKKGFTGTAPIPYTILAGTYLVDCEPKRFFEWKREDEKFIELSAKKKVDYPELIIKEMNAPNMDAESVIVAISTTRRIQKHQLSDFGEQDFIEIYLEDCKDNNITYVKQLQNYRKIILDELEALGRDKYPRLKQINLVAAIPSCLSLEIGRMIAENNSRVKKIVVYHFANQGTKLYPFGITVTEMQGQYKKGELIEN